MPSRGSILPGLDSTTIPDFLSNFLRAIIGLCVSFYLVIDVFFNLDFGFLKDAVLF